MKLLEFEIDIDAKPEHVWFILWDDFYYRKWTAVFHEGSYAKSDWKEGSRIHFLSPEGNGMYSEIEVLLPFEKMHFKHLGEIKNFVEQPVSSENEEWVGAIENYNLIEVNGKTHLAVILGGLTEGHVEYFKEAFTKGLAIVKQCAEELTIHIETEVKAPITKVWEFWTKPEHIKNWNNASDDWHTPFAANDLRIDGSFKTTMAAKDGSFSFDFEGIYTDVEEYKTISYKIADGRKVSINFIVQDDVVKIIETFEPEAMNSLALQKTGWQAILDNFKLYTLKHL